MIKIENLRKISGYLWEIPQSFRRDMKVPARFYASEDMLSEIMRDRSLGQLVNLAALPGIRKYALAMPDIHEGYGAPIGGVFASSVEDGVISPGAVGYDINCGVRLLASDENADEIRKKTEKLADLIFDFVPSGVGRGGDLKLSRNEMDDVLENGMRWALEKGFADPADLLRIEEQGSMPGAIASAVSDRAKSRGRDQIGTLGSGNHFLEVQKIEEIYDEAAAMAFGLQKNNITAMIHCGSRGLGHQTCTDYLRKIIPRLDEWKIKLPDRELACAPVKSDIGRQYFGAMAACANFAWVNRTVIAANVRNAWKQAGLAGNLRTVYDAAHNMAKIEEHEMDGEKTKVCVHRKGATRAFGPGRIEIQEDYRPHGQPVLIPGTMGTASYVLVGTESAMEQTFGTSCHGAGRRMSRKQAKREVRGVELRELLEEAGIIVRCDSNAGLAEEAPSAYKDVDAVIDVVHNAGLAKKVAKLKPLAVVKGG